MSMYAGYVVSTSVNGKSESRPILIGNGDIYHYKKAFVILTIAFATRIATVD